MLDDLKRRYERYVERYEHFARMRGFTTPINDWPFVRRSFLECWAEPGFHRFWQVWNPGIAYFIHRLFLRLGGRRRWVAPTVLSFTICGVVHTVIVAPFVGGWGWSVIVAFLCFGLLTAISRLAAPVLRQERWPRALNAMLNLALVAGSFDIGFRVDGWLA